MNDKGFSRGGMPLNGVMRRPQGMGPQQGFYTPNWNQIFGPSLDRYQVQAHQSQQQAQNGFGGGNGPIRQGLGGLGQMFQNGMNNFRNNMQDLGAIFRGQTPNQAAFGNMQGSSTGGPVGPKPPVQKLGLGGLMGMLGRMPQKRQMRGGY